MTPLAWVALFAAALWAGAQNALAGGGSFVTFPALLLTGLDPRAANITTTIAMFPGQLSTGFAGRRYWAAAGGLSVRALTVISLAGGALGALLLLATPASFFARLVPWLVLFATGVFAWGNFRKKPATPRSIGWAAAAIIQFLIAVYGGYFGGGIGFMMLAVLTAAGLAVRNAGATKNLLAGVMNGAAVLVFLFSRDVAWLQAVVVGVAAVTGGLMGAWALNRVNERVLRLGVVVIGVLLTIGLFLRGS